MITFLKLHSFCCCEVATFPKFRLENFRELSNMFTNANKLRSTELKKLQKYTFIGKGSHCSDIIKCIKNLQEGNKT